MSFSLLSPEYRSDIAGLRALAVLSVVFCHAGIVGFDGGYVGVDVFFVISGYLLTGQVLSALYQGEFSFGDFYARRARRIVPPLVVMVVATLAAGFYLLMPDALADTGKAARQLAYFFSNHYLHGSVSSHQDLLALGEQPLLPTWAISLGVQYFLVLPGLLVLLFRGARRSRADQPGTFEPPPIWVVCGVLTGLALISFALSSNLLQHDPSAAFYLVTSRAWELLAGGVLASLARSRLSRPPLWLAEICAIAGLICLLWGVLTYSATTPFPAGQALTPVMGTGLLLYAGYARTPAMLTRVLSWRILVGIGLMSYSLYLWHWPLWVLSRSTVWSVQNWPALPVLSYLGIVFVVSWLSWKCIERPFQAKWVAALKPWVVLSVSLVLLAVCYGIGAWGIHQSRTDQQDLPPALTQLERDTSVAPGMACEGKPELDAIRAGTSGCDLGGPATPASVPDFILLGDSHARMWAGAFDSLSRELGLHGVAMAYANCAPLYGAVSYARPACAGITQAALDYVVRSPVSQVILAGYWTQAAETAFVPASAPTGVAATTGDPAAGATDVPATAAGTAQATGVGFSAALRNTIQTLQRAGKAVTVVLDVPRLANDDVPSDLALQSISQDGAPMYGPGTDEHKARQAIVMKSIEEIWPDVKPFGIVDPTIELCSSGHCLVARDGRTWYRNQHQLTDDAAQALRGAFMPLLRSVSAPR